MLRYDHFNHYYWANYDFFNPEKYDHVNNAYFYQDKFKFDYFQQYIDYLIKIRSDHFNQYYDYLNQLWSR